MNKNLKKHEEKRERSRGLDLRRETILTLADPLLGFAVGGGTVMPTSSGIQTDRGTS